MQTTIEDPTISTTQATRMAAVEDSLGLLNERQREAASCGNGPLLIVAGAGTGKTATLVHRVAWLIARGVDPGRILLLTFTRRAAAEMLRRVDALLRIRHSVGVPVEPSGKVTARSGAAPSTPSPPGCCGATACHRPGPGSPSSTAPTPRTC